MSSSPFTLFNPLPAKRDLSASIWAPKRPTFEQPWSAAADEPAQPLDDMRSMWHRQDPPRSYSYSNNYGHDERGDYGSYSLRDTRYAHVRPVGAIGDGRKKTLTPELGDAHVEQLFRTLNLNSPTPYVHPSSFSAHPDLSPDVSPISQTSALMTPLDRSPASGALDLKYQSSFDFGSSFTPQGQSLFMDSGSPQRGQDFLLPSQSPYYQSSQLPSVGYQHSPNTLPFLEPFSEQSSPSRTAPSLPYTTQAPQMCPQAHTFDSGRQASTLWRQQNFPTSSEWIKPLERQSVAEYSPQFSLPDLPLPVRAAPQVIPQHQMHHQEPAQTNDPINFLSLLHPSSSPPYHLFVARIIKSADQQASIFLQQKLKVADPEERIKIVDAICSRGYEMMAHRFGNWAVQRCLEAATTAEERRKIVSCMRGRVVDLAMNCYGCHVLQKALDCEEDIRLLIVTELLLGDPAQTLVNKHASHVWSKVMELTWTPPAPPIFAYVNASLKGQWAALACHETGSLVVQHAFENLEETAKDDIVDELLNRGPGVFAEVTKNQWGSYCIQHILEHGSPKHRQMALDHLTSGLLEYATSEQGAKSINKALKEGGKETLDKIIKRMAEPAKGGRRAMIVDLALSPTGSQLIANVLPHVDKEQRTLLYDSIRGHIVTLRGCKTGSKVIWLFDRMRAYYGY